MNFSHIGRCLLAVLVTLGFPAVPRAFAAEAKGGACQLSVFAMPVTMEGMRASVPVKVDGKQTRFWLDSGAWFSIMSLAKAQELGLAVTAAPKGLTMSGIGGSFRPKIARIKDFAVVGAELHDVDFLVGGSDAGNGFIGRNLLAAYDTEFDLPHGRVGLVTPINCAKSTAMAYWAGDHPYFSVELLRGPAGGVVRDLNLPVIVNGVKIVAAIDSGATTILTRRAAERAGIDLSGPDVVPTSGISGFGRSYARGWVVPVASVAIGDETILRTRLLVIDGTMGEGEGAPDMLLGVDFLLAHHVYVSQGQRRIYFTYTGGKPFVSAYADKPAPAGAALPGGPSPAAKAAVPEGMRRVEATDTAAAPVRADEFARRGSARLAGGDTRGAITDFSEAIRLDPGNASYFAQRAKAHGEAGEDETARTDFDRAIALAPNDPKLLTARAWIRRGEKDEAGARADAEAAAKLTPPASLEMNTIAGLMIELGDAARAASLLNATIAAHKDDARYATLLNTRCWARGLAAVELDAALVDCNLAIRLAGKAGGILDSRALVRFRQRNYAAALADYDVVLKGHEDEARFAWSRYMRGQTRTALGRADAGKIDHDAAIKADATVLDRARRYGL